jgi:hypothetical protein
MTGSGAGSRTASEPRVHKSNPSNRIMEASGGRVRADEHRLLATTDSSTGVGAGMVGYFGVSGGPPNRTLAFL